MKIYCSRQEKLLRDFIGKPLWVLVYEHGDIHYPLYVRVRCMSNNKKLIYVNQVHVYNYNNLPMAYESMKDKVEYYIQNPETWINWYGVNQLQIAQPLHVLTDEDMLDLLQADLDIFDTEDFE